MAPSQFRRPADDAELKYWLQVMVWYHHYGDEEIRAATGLTLEEIQRLRAQWEITVNNRPKRPAGSPVLVLPYPGGRHPRIQFLEGAIRPQRETKVSVFTPWDDTSYVVVDVPEAIFTHLGLTYLAHEHVPTIWTQKGIELPRLEWNRRPDRSLDLERTLPNGIAFGARVRPGQREARMELWIRNGLSEPLRDLRIQNCAMLKGLTGFEAMTNDNKLFAPPYAACKSSTGTRWVIHAWEACGRAWGNPPCPCLHSDPQVKEIAPGETRTLRGIVAFYEGTDVQPELKRLEGTGWRDA